jgi:hypothetical protein
LGTANRAVAFINKFLFAKNAPGTAFLRTFGLLVKAPFWPYRWVSERPGGPTFPEPYTKEETVIQPKNFELKFSHHD